MVTSVIYNRELNSGGCGEGPGGPGARFSKVPIINGPVKLFWFTCKIEVSVVLHKT